MIFERGRGRPGHARSGLRPEVLDDNLLNVTIAVVEFPQGQERLDALGARLADADQHTSGEGHARFAREPDGLEARRGPLVGRPMMRSAALAQTLCRAFEHDPLRNGNLAQHCDVGSIENPGINVRQQPRLFKYRARRRGEIGQGCFVPELAKLLARRAVAQFRLIPEREQRFLAIRRGAGPREGEDLIERQVGCFFLSRGVGERAVVAHVPTELGQRDKNLAGISYNSAVRSVSPRGGRPHERVEIGMVRERETLVSR